MYMRSPIGSLNFNSSFSFSVLPLFGVAKSIKTNNKTPNNKKQTNKPPKNATQKTPQPQHPKQNTTNQAKLPTTKQKK